MAALAEERELTARRTIEVRAELIEPAHGVGPPAHDRLHGRALGESATNAKRVRDVLLERIVRRLDGGHPSLSVGGVRLAQLGLREERDFGSVLGAVAGYWGGWLDIVLSRLLDTIMAFPLFVLAMGIVAALGNTIENIIYATAIINIPFYARLVRAEDGLFLAHVSHYENEEHRSVSAVRLVRLDPNAPGESSLSPAASETSDP